MSEKVRAAEVFPVSVFLKEEMAVRYWKIRNFHESFMEILEGRLITRSESSMIGTAFGVSPNLMWALQESYLKWHDDAPHLKILEGDE